MPITATRKDIQFNPDSSRVIARFFMPGKERAESIIRKVIAMTEDAVSTPLNQVLREFANRHRNITKIFEKHFTKVQNEIKECNIKFESLSEQKKLLIGSYFTSEYSIESAAFFNPSIVEHPDQANLEKDVTRVIISFRATGEGHISSLVFRSGELDKDNNFTLYPVGKMLDEAEVITRHVYSKKSFCAKLDEMHNRMDIVELVVSKLKDKFIYGDLQAAIVEVKKEITMSHSKTQAIKHMNWLANSHYEITFSRDAAISERVIFPISYTERNGIEDARFVRFTDDDGSIIYYGTYTAYDGTTILPKLIRTKDFCQFKVMPLNGECVQNKNLALFPRKINGKYVMVSRLDGVNNYIMYSDKINLWQKAEKLQQPVFPWELVQIGNAGSPIETEHGWLMVTHGVGPMRKYCLGATLLDLDNPSKIIGQTSEPILSPNVDEREGYVPNVVYSCGSIIHNNELIIPYAQADYASSIVTISLDELFTELLPPKTSQSTLNKKSYSILLIDDDPVSQGVMATFLKSDNYTVTVASNAIDALKYIAKNKYDLILSDIIMPNFDGLQLLETLNIQGNKIPVVLITNSASSDMEAKGLKLGAVEYIRKPLKQDIFLLRIKKILAR
ncbi:response regulator [bacterium]|nr:response regulator [bacterium]